MNTMLDQIYSLPALIREAVQPYDESARATLDHELCRSVKRIFTTGCGDSHHATIATELAMETLTGLPVEPMTAMQFARYGAGFLPSSGPKTNLVIGISVSGEVSRTIEALAVSRKAGATTVALTATPTSRVAKAAELMFDAKTAPFPDPPGTHTPGVRSYLASQLGLFLMAVRIGEVRGHLTGAQASAARAEIAALAGAAEKTIANCDKPARALAEEWKDATEFVFVGGGPNFSSAIFSAAKVLEASGDSALGQETEEWAHLQYFARTANAPTFIITAADRDLSRAVEVAVAAKTIGRRVAAICPASATGVVENAARVLPIADGVREMYSAVVASIPGELFAAHRADVIGEPFFRNFGGGRNQEGGGGISRIRTSDMWDTAR